MLANNNKMTIKWNHVLGHRGIPGNEEADELAVKGATLWCTIRVKSKKISNDQELIQSDPISCPQNQKGNN